MYNWSVFYFIDGCITLPASVGIIAVESSIFCLDFGQSSRESINIPLQNLYISLKKTPHLIPIL